MKYIIRTMLALSVACSMRAMEIEVQQNKQLTDLQTELVKFAIHQEGQQSILTKILIGDQSLSGTETAYKKMPILTITTVLADVYRTVTTFKEQVAYKFLGAIQALEKAQKKSRDRADIIVGEINVLEEGIDYTYCGGYGSVLRDWCCVGVTARFDKEHKNALLDLVQSYNRKEVSQCWHCYK